MAGNIKIIVLIALGALAYVFFGQIEHRVNKQQTLSSQIEPKGVLEEKAAPKEVISDSKFKKITQRQVAMVKNGLDDLGYNVGENGEALLTVKLKLKPVCHSGDLQVVEKLYGKSGKFLLSIESMDKGGFVTARRISAADMLAEREFSFPIDISKPQVFGIYMCGDSESVGKCSAKAAVDFNYVLSGYEVEKQKDSVFYYQFAIIGDQTSKIYTGPPSAVMNAKHTISKENPDLSVQLQRASTTLGQVRSYPPVSKRLDDSWLLELFLAQGDPDECRKQGYR